jgi:CheY-like chemotaxis protein
VLVQNLANLLYYNKLKYVTETNKKIIVVEDDLAMREIVVHKLSSKGFKVKEAENGKLGLDLIIAEKPDLVLLDLMMPELDGFGVLTALRALPDKQLANTKVIVLSNLWSNEDILKAKSFGVADFLVKAYFTPEDIFAKIIKVLEADAEKSGN